MTTHHEPVMGSIASIRIDDPRWPTRPIESAMSWLHEVDRRFSRYQPDSEMSLVASGRLAESDAHPEIREVLAIADAIALESDGAFDARRWGHDGVDPTGVVKGWAVQRAAQILIDAGVERFAIGVGGDFVVRAGGGAPWRIGIRHPVAAHGIAAVVQLRDGAIATSATYERGPHIVDPRDHRPADHVVSATVVGPDLTYTDAFATTAFVMGDAGLGWVERHRGYAAYLIGSDARCRWTPLMDRYLVDPAAAAA